MKAQKITRRTSRQWSRRRGTSGILAMSPRACASVNSGVSSRLRRMKNATTTTIALAQNGMRQP